MNGFDYDTPIYEKFVSAIEEYTGLSKEVIAERGTDDSARRFEATFTDDIVSDNKKIRQRYEESDFFMFRNPQYYKNREEEGFGYFLDALKDMPKDTKILDFGCGAGVFTELLLRKGYTNIYMVDVACPTTNFAKWFFKDRATVWDDPDNIPEKFDVICSNSVFEHLPDPLATAGYLQRCLNSGGKLVISMAIDKGGPHLSKAIDKFGIVRSYVESNGGLMRS